MAYWPRIQAQLDGSKTAGEDCGPRASSVGVDWATEGAKVPDIPPFRKRAKRLTGDTNTEQLTTALRSYDKPAETGDRSPVRVSRQLRQPRSSLRDAITAGRYVVVQMSYAVVNQRRADLSGDPRFQGMHSIGVLGQRVEAGEVQWRVYDALADGRRAGIAKGPDWWPRWLVEQAAAAFTKRAETWSGVIIFPTKPIK